MPQFTLAAVAVPLPTRKLDLHGISPSAQARRLDMAARALDLGVELAAAGDDLARAATPLLTPGGDAPAGVRLAETAKRAGPLLATARAHLDRATALRATVDRDALQGR